MGRHRPCWVRERGARGGRAFRSSRKTSRRGVARPQPRRRGKRNSGSPGHPAWWAVGCGSRGRVRLSACPLPGCFGTRVERLKGVKLVEATRDRSSTGCLEYWRGHTEYSGSAGLRRRPTFRPEPSFRRTPRVRLPRSENRPYSSYPPPQSRLPRSSRNGAITAYLATSWASVSWSRCTSRSDHRLTRMKR
jgi:hypothetical protein